MKWLGYVLLVVGFLAGTYFAVRTAAGIETLPYLAALVAAIAGVALLRLATHQAAREESHLASSLETLKTSLHRLLEQTEQLARDKGSLDVYDLRHHIDQHLADDLASFAAARQAMAHRYGLSAYAEVMGSFAAGERYLNRVWSTSTDGYIDEAHAYIDRARDQMRETWELFGKLG